MAPSSTSSMLGCVAAVTETESPSQPKPAVIQRMCMSEMGDGFCVFRPYGTASAVMASVSPLGSLASQQENSQSIHKTYPGLSGVRNQSQIGTNCDSLFRLGGLLRGKGFHNRESAE